MATVQAIKSEPVKSYRHEMLQALTNALSEINRELDTCASEIKDDQCLVFLKDNYETLIVTREKILNAIGRISQAV